MIGTLTESLEAIEMAKRAGYTAVVSPPFREHEDTTTPLLLQPTLARSRLVHLSYRACCWVQPASPHEDDLAEGAEYLGMDAFYNLR